MEVGSPNFQESLILTTSPLGLNMGLIDLDLQGHLVLRKVSFTYFGRVSTISPQQMDLEMPNFHKLCVWVLVSLGLNMDLIDLGLQGHFRLFWARLYRKSSMDGVRNAKFPQTMHHNIYMDWIWGWLTLKVQVTSDLETMFSSNLSLSVCTFDPYQSIGSQPQHTTDLQAEGSHIRYWCSCLISHQIF